MRSPELSKSYIINQELEYEKLNKTVEYLNRKLEKINNDNEELRKINKTLISKLNLLINDQNLIKDVKVDIHDYSDLTNYNNEDTLKEFFYLTVLSEKMKYLNMDYIWVLDSDKLYKKVQNLDLAFYEWQPFLNTKFQHENELFNISKRKEKENKNFGIMQKLK
jgi:hypothetical protein